MIVKVTSKGQITLPAEVLEALGVEPGGQLELEECPGWFILRPKRIGSPQPRPIDYSKLGTLGDKIPPDYPPFDIRKFREEICAPKRRD